MLDSTKLKEFADVNFKLDEMAESFQRLWKTVGKGEIACYEQLFLFAQCFQETCNAET